MHKEPKQLGDVVIFPSHSLLTEAEWEKDVSGIADAYHVLVDGRNGRNLVVAYTKSPSPVGMLATYMQALADDSSQAIPGVASEINPSDFFYVSGPKGYPKPDVPSANPQSRSR